MIKRYVVGFIIILTLGTTGCAPRRLSPSGSGSSSSASGGSDAGGGGGGGSTSTSALSVGKASDQGDVDRDGDLDLVVPLKDSDQVKILLGNAAGGFTSSTVTVGDEPVAVLLADFDQDGDLDLVASNYVDGTISLLKNNGSGSFAAQVTSTVGTQPSEMAAGDFNGDSYPDLAVVNRGSNNVSILTWNSGGGVFNAATTVTVGTEPEAIAVGDFNRNGKLDLAVTNAADNTVTVLSGDGSAGFSAFGGSPFTVGTRPVAIAVGNVNADPNGAGANGTLDIVTANFDSDNVSFLSGNGSGGFAAAANFSTGNEPSAVVLADHDQDGDLDIITADGAGNTVSVLAGDNAGSFGAASSSAAGTAPRGVVVGDFARNGKPDMVSTDYTGTATYVAGTSTGGGNGTFTQSSYLPVDEAPNNCSVADVDLDGDLDVLISVNYLASSPYGGVVVHLNNGAGTFSTSAGNKYRGSGDEGDGLTVADYNNDGWPDIVEGSNNNIRLFTNDGDGTFTNAGDTSVSTIGGNATSCPVALRAGDFNRDGNMDVAIAMDGCWGDHASVQVYSGNGAGTFTQQIYFDEGTAAGKEIKKLEVADFNRDGILDIVYAQYGTNVIRVKLGDGSFGFSNVNLTSTITPQDIHFGDFNHDGYLDIIEAGTTYLGAFFGVNGSTFDTEKTYNNYMNQSTYGLRVWDYDNDGHLDVLTGHLSDQMIDVMKGDGSSSGTTAFTTTYQSAATGIQPDRLCQGDLNSDGKMDAISTDKTTNKRGVVYLGN